MATALPELRDAPIIYSANHRDASLAVAVTCSTRGEQTVDYCYTQFKDGYKVHSLPALDKSEHGTIFLLLKYKQRLNRKFWFKGRSHTGTCSDAAVVGFIEKLLLR